MKKEKGITLIALVLTVMILSILVGVATYTGIDTIKSSKFTRFETELKMMQTKVNEWYEEYKNGDNTYLTLGQEISANSDVEDQSNKVFTSNASGITDKEGYRYFSIETLKTLGIEGIEKPYFINIEKRRWITGREQKRFLREYCKKGDRRCPKGCLFRTIL